MSKYRQAAKVDQNELEIREYLRSHGVYVIPGHDDMLCYNLNTLKQIEVKKDTPFKKDGTLKKGFIKASQYKILENANDNYGIVWSKEGALAFLLGDNHDYITPSMYRKNAHKWRPDRITTAQKADIIFNHWTKGL
jgi:hypothetical protein